MTWERRVITACLAIGILACGCGSEDVDKHDYTTRNKKILDEVPLYPGATLETSFATEDRTGNGSPYENGGPITAYWSTRRYGLPGAVTPANVIRFYRRQLRRLHWHDKGSTPCSHTFGRGREALYLDACFPAGFSLMVNHAAPPIGP
jgi:hypothetical protein